MSDLNKDIEIVKEIITHKDDYDVYFGYRIAKPYSVSAEEIQAISNVLSRLKEYKDIEQDYIANEEKLADLISKLEKELETYKKIAEKLAGDLSKHIWLNDKEAIIKIYREKVEEDEVYS